MQAERETAAAEAKGELADTTKDRDYDQEYLDLMNARRHDGRSAKFRQNVARFRLYRLRILQENMRFAAFFKIYQILMLKFLKFGKLLQILRHLRNVC